MKGLEKRSKIEKLSGICICYNICSSLVLYRCLCLQRGTLHTSIVLCNSDVNKVFMPTWRVTDMGNCTIVSLCALLWKQGSAVAVKGSVLGLCDLESYDSASVTFFDNIIKSDVVLCGSKEQRVHSRSGYRNHCHSPQIYFLTFSKQGIFPFKELR